MAAGQGFKTFTTGEVLTAGDVNGYLMQGINVFANATARDAAITAPAEGQFAFLKDTNVTYYYDGAAWVVSGATGDITSVTATSPITGGGASGDVTIGIQNASTTQRGSVQLTDSTATTDSTLAATATAVKSAYDLGAAAIPKSTVTTAGDLIYATGASTVTRRAIGTTGQVLSVSGGVPTWSTISSGGMTLLSTTTLSGASVTVSSISTAYTQLYGVILGMQNSTAQGNLRISCLNDTTHHFMSIMNLDTNAVLTNTAYFGTNQVIDNTNANNCFAFTISNYVATNSQAIKPIQFWGGYQGASQRRSIISAGFYDGTTGDITSLTISNSGGSLTTGTLLLYGVK